MIELPLAAVRKKLRYEPDTGLFYWISSGKIAGHKSARGSVDIKINGRLCFAHRLAIAMSSDHWPTQIIDHINGNRSDNRLCNLRLSDQVLNQQNRRTAPKHSSTGLLGVTRRVGNRFQAKITVHGKLQHIGSFGSAEAAHEAYVARKRQVHEACQI
jgi:hypothetical protein